MVEFMNIYFVVVFYLFWFSFVSVGLLKIKSRSLEGDRVGGGLFFE